MRRTALGLVLAPALTVALTGCWNGSGGSEAKSVVLITLDTTRADRLGTYGHAAAATPVLDRLASEGARFDEALSPVPVTLPSHATMFTGLYPATHGVRYNGMFRLPEATLTIAEVLRDAGFSTGAITGAYPVNGKSGLAQGFSHYDDDFGKKPGSSDDLNERPAGEVTSRAIAWLTQRRGERFFLWVHYFDPHGPYAPPFPYSAQFRDRPYDGEIAYVDAEIGKLRAWLEGEGLWENLLVVVAGDHGEGLWDHGEKAHQYLAYQSTMHVPFIVKAPGGTRPRVVAEPVSLADVGPTILDFAGAKPIPAAEGVSLRKAIFGAEPPRRDLYFEALTGSLLHGWAPIEGVRRGRWKLIRSVDSELYDLEADAGEKADVLRNEPSLAADLEAALSGMIERMTSRASPAETVAVPLDAEELQRLASLGYVGGTISAERRGGPHPKAKIHLEPDLTMGAELMEQKEFGAALDTWKRVLNEDPSNRYVLLNAATCAQRLERIDDALDYAGRLVASYPEFLPGALFLGDLHVARGDFRRAAAAFREGVSRHPDDVQAAYRLALALAASGESLEAERVIEETLARSDLAVDRGAFLVIRALCRAQLHDPIAADTLLRSAIAAGYRDREILENEPTLAPLRSLPGFRSIVASIPEKGP